MDAEVIFRTIVNLVPTWYIAEYGTHQYQFKIGNRMFSFCSHRAMTPALDSFYSSINGSINNIANLPDVGVPGFTDLLQEIYALKWLQSQCPDMNWTKVISYFHSLSKRTYENEPVAMNLVVVDGEGHHDLTKPSCQKFIDQLAASHFTYFAVDRELRTIGYEQIDWSQITDAGSYKYHPEFLHPFHCILKQLGGNYSIHLTSNGDLVIMNSAGPLAAQRKGHWKVYDLNTFKNMVVDSMGDYYVGANLFEFLFDLSFKRHGALLIYDPYHLVLQEIVNPESVLKSNADIDDESGQAMIAETIRDLALGISVSKPFPKKHLLMELASVDGAIVFDKEHILSVGAVIKPHKDVGNYSGARMTAALSAYHWGGFPANVSSDGQITLYFKSTNDKGSCLALLEFL